MTPLVKHDYNFKEIKRLLKKHNGDPYQEKWAQIAAHYDVSPSAVYRWFYRKQAEKNPAISSDTWRTVYQLLAGKNATKEFSRGKIAEIKEEIKRMIDES